MWSFKWSNKWLVLWSLWATRLMRQPTPAVRVSGGWLRGTVAPAGTHLQYLGVPYATVPNRFQAPGLEKAWKGILEADNENIRCEQELSDGLGITIGRTDCLYLNIYTPLDASPEDSLPVMVFIHGGGFYSGSSSQALLGPEYLINKGVILVVMNYRLNVEGFLCLGIKEAPGNAGLKDQVAALKWVKRNIQVFGGDVDNVTIFGESAGSVAVSTHILSKMSRGLFHKAIMQSGSSLGGCSIQYDPVDIASRKAKVLGFESTDPYELYEFLKNQSETDLIAKAVPREEGNLIISELIFLPCIEKKFNDIEPFLTETPYEILSKGDFNKVPMIIGTNSEEGLFFVNVEKDHFIPRVKLDVALPKNLAFPSINERKQVAKEVHKLFFGDEDITFQNLYNLSKFIIESFMEYPVLEETDIIARMSDKPVYSYIFNYDGWRNIAKHMMPRKEFKNVTGATHADDLFYLFSQQLIPTLIEKDIINKMTTMWTNFAKYGDPTPPPSQLIRWPPASKEEEHRKILLIDQHINVISQPKKPSLAFWRTIYSKYRRKTT